MKRYSTIRLGRRHKAHIFDHFEERVLCGINRFKFTPFKINKIKLNADTMAKTFNNYAKRRGANPYKFTCRKCIRLINNME